MLSKCYLGREKRRILDEIVSIIDCERKQRLNITSISVATNVADLRLWRDALVYFQTHKPKMPKGDRPKRNMTYTRPHSTYTSTHKKILVDCLNEMMADYRKVIRLPPYVSIAPLKPGISGEFYHAVIDFLTARANGKQK